MTGEVAAGVEADPALLGLGDVAAGAAEPHLVLDLGERVDQPAYVGRVGGEQVEGDPLGALGTDAGQPPELVDEVLDRAFVHARSLCPGPTAAGLPRRWPRKPPGRIARSHRQHRAMTPEPDPHATSPVGAGAGDRVLPGAAAPPETLDLRSPRAAPVAPRRPRRAGAVVARSVAHLTPFMGWAAEADRETSLDYLERCDPPVGRRTRPSSTPCAARRRRVVGSCGLMSRIGPARSRSATGSPSTRCGRASRPWPRPVSPRPASACPGSSASRSTTTCANDVSGRVPARLGFTRLRERAGRGHGPGARPGRTSSGRSLRRALAGQPRPRAARPRWG